MYLLESLILLRFTQAENMHLGAMFYYIREAPSLIDVGSLYGGLSFYVYFFILLYASLATNSPDFRLTDEIEARSFTIFQDM